MMSAPYRWRWTEISSSRVRTARAGALSGTISAPDPTTTFLRTTISSLSHTIGGIMSFLRAAVSTRPHCTVAGISHSGSSKVVRCEATRACTIVARPES